MVDEPRRPHIPVLLAEVLEQLDLRPGLRAIDATLGRGGHASAILDRIRAADASPQLLGLDRDPSALDYVREHWPADDLAKTRLVHGRIADLPRLAADHRMLPADRILADLGVSSPQFDEAGRGFSFMHDGPLDMRMSSNGPTARDLLLRTPTDEIARILFEFGEERHSRRIARAIEQARRDDPTQLATTRAFAHLVRRAIPGGMKRGQRIDPATRSFQALRIAVNDELGELDALLAAIPDLLAVGGKIAIISFHSLEDRRVKHAYRELAAPHPATGADGPYRIINRKPITATDDESAGNPRSRSAKMRILERTA